MWRFHLSRWLVCAAISLTPGLARAAKVSAVDAPAPIVSFSLRSVADHTVEQGEPFVVKVRLAVPHDSTTTFALAPAAGDWTSGVLVEIAKDKNAPPLARAAVVGRPTSPAITLESKRSVGGLWQFSSEALKGIAPGDYVVRVRLKIDGGTGWTGDVSAAPTKLKVVTASSDSARVTQSTLGRAQEAMLADRNEDAAKLIDGLLAKTPKNREALILRAVLSEKAGNFAAALFCVNLASSGLAADGPPPADLYDLKTRLQGKVFGGPATGAGAKSLPAWSWPPRELYADIEKAALTATPASAAKPAPLKSFPVKTESTQPAPRSSNLSDKPAGVSATTFAEPAKSGKTEAGTVVSAAELSDAKILTDVNGQWAVSASAGSQYDKRTYSAAKATGAPDVSVAGNSPDAWCPAGKNTGTDWLEVSFGKPVRAAGVRVRQNDTVGSVTKIEAIEPNGTVHVWWEGADPYVAPAVREIVWFGVRVPRTDYLVTKVKISLNLAAPPGWKQIDAVQLVAASDDK